MYPLWLLWKNIYKLFEVSSKVKKIPLYEITWQVNAGSDGKCQGHTN